MKEYLTLINAIVVVCLIHMLVRPGTMEVAGFFIACLLFMQQAYEASKRDVIENKMVEQEAKLQDQIDRLWLALTDQDRKMASSLENFEGFKHTQEKLEKSAEDIKKVISTANLGAALYTRVRKRDA